MMSEAPTHRTVASLRREVGHAGHAHAHDDPDQVLVPEEPRQARGGPGGRGGGARGALRRARRRGRRARAGTRAPRASCRNHENSVAAASAASGPGGGPAVDEDEPYGLVAAVLRRGGGDRRNGRGAVAHAGRARRAPGRAASRAPRAGDGTRRAHGIPLVLEDLAETLLAVGDFPGAQARRQPDQRPGPEARARGAHEARAGDARARGGVPGHRQARQDGGRRRRRRGARGAPRARRGTRRAVEAEAEAAAAAGPRSGPGPRPRREGSFLRGDRFGRSRAAARVATLRLRRCTWAAVAECLAASVAQPSTPSKRRREAGANPSGSPSPAPPRDAAGDAVGEAHASASPAAPTTPDAESDAAPGSDEDGGSRIRDSGFDVLALLGARVRFVAPGADGGFEESRGRPIPPAPAGRTPKKPPGPPGPPPGAGSPSRLAPPTKRFSQSRRATFLASARLLNRHLRDRT